MNRIDTAAISGSTGQPFSKRTLEHLMSNFPQLATAILALAGQPAGVTLLTATEIVDPAPATTWSVGACMALYDGQLLEVPAHTLELTGTDELAWQIVETPRVGDPVILTNGATVSPHIQAQLRLVAVAAGNPASLPLLSETHYLLQEVGGTAPFFRQQEWVMIPLPVGVTSTAFFDVPAYRRDTSGMVHIRGGCTAPTGSSTLLCTLPVGFRPGTRTRFLVNINLTDSRTASCEITTDGNVYLLVSGAPGSTNFMVLDGTSFLVEN